MHFCVTLCSHSAMTLHETAHKQSSRFMITDFAQHTTRLKPTAVNCGHVCLKRGTGLPVTNKGCLIRATKCTGSLVLWCHSLCLLTTGPWCVRRPGCVRGRRKNQPFPVLISKVAKCPNITIVEVHYLLYFTSGPWSGPKHEDVTLPESERGRPQR